MELGTSPSAPQFPAEQLAWVLARPPGRPPAAGALRLARALWAFCLGDPACALAGNRGRALLPLEGHTWLFCSPVVQVCLS